MTSRFGANQLSGRVDPTALELRVAEVASVEAARLHGVSNLNAVSDGIRVSRTILREWHRKRGHTEAHANSVRRPESAEVKTMVAVSGES